MEMNGSIGGMNGRSTTVASGNSDPDSVDLRFRKVMGLRKGYLAYASPKGSQALRGYLVRPSQQFPPLSAVLVIHDDHGLTPGVEQVVDQWATAGFLAFAPDALSSLGRFRADDWSTQERNFLESEIVTEDFIAAVKFLQSHWAASGHVNVLGVGRGSSIAERVMERIANVMPTPTMAG